MGCNGLFDVRTLFSLDSVTLKLTDNLWLRQELKDAALDSDGFEQLSVTKARANGQSSITQPEHDSQPNASFTIPVVTVKDRHRSRTTSSLRTRHSIAELPSLSHMDHFREPQAPSLLPASAPHRWLPPIAPDSRQRPEYDQHETREHFFISGRARALSATTSNVSWNDRALPFISSMRRTSIPNLTSSDHQHLDRDSRPGTRPPSAMYHNPHNPGSARYEDVNMRSEDDDYTLTSRYMVQPERRRTSPIKMHEPWLYDKRGHR